MLAMSKRQTDKTTSNYNTRSKKIKTVFSAKEQPEPALTKKLVSDEILEKYEKGKWVALDKTGPSLFTEICVGNTQGEVLKDLITKYKVMQKKPTNLFVFCVGGETPQTVIDVHQTT